MCIWDQVQDKHLIRFGKVRKPNLHYLHVFGSKCYVLNDREHLRKFDPKSDESVFVGYILNNRAYRVYNIRTQIVMESINVVFDDKDDFFEFSQEG